MGTFETLRADISLATASLSSKLYPTLHPSIMNPGNPAASTSAQMLPATITLSPEIIVRPSRSPVGLTDAADRP